MLRVPFRYVMSHAIVGVFLAFIALMAASCYEGSIIRPATGAGTDYPCGKGSEAYHMHRCYNDVVLGAKENGCCGEGFECTADNIQRMYAYPGYCRWRGPSF